MRKIKTSGLKAEHNFGNYSVLHGMFEFLHVVYHQ